MPDDEDLDESEETDEERSRKAENDLRALRRKANKADEAEAQNVALRKEMAFIRAGVDTESPIGALFYRSYEGELDVATIKAEAEKLGLSNSPTPPEDPDAITDAERRATDERQALASGAATDTGQTAEPDPRTDAVRTARRLVHDGKSEDDAIAAGVASIIGAAVRGDQRASWDPARDF